MQKSCDPLAQLTKHIYWQERGSIFPCLLLKMKDALHEDVDDRSFGDPVHRDRVRCGTRARGSQVVRRACEHQQRTCGLTPHVRRRPGQRVRRRAPARPATRRLRGTGLLVLAQGDPRLLAPRAMEYRQLVPRVARASPGT